MPLCCDATFKLHDGGWALLIVGTVTVRKDEKGCAVTSFRPIAYSLAFSESEKAYVKLFQCLADFARRAYAWPALLRAALPPAPLSAWCAIARCSVLVLCEKCQRAGRNPKEFDPAAGPSMASASTLRPCARITARPSSTRLARCFRASSTCSAGPTSCALAQRRSRDCWRTRSTWASSDKC